MRSTRTAAVAPSVHVRIAEPSIALNLSAGDTARAAVKGRALRPEEAQVVELWRERGLDRPGFRSGQLLSFLHQLHDVLEYLPSLRRSQSDGVCVVTRTSLDCVPPGP